MTDQIVVAFDAYGTLLSTASISKQLAEHFTQEQAETVAAAWRKYQLEYTWRLNSMNQYQPFDEVTLHSLRHALSESSLTLSDTATDSIMESYASLAPYDDAASTLAQITAHPSVRAVVFTNGTPRTITPAIARLSASLPVVTVDPVRRFKPAPETYAHLASSTGVPASHIWLVSGNPFDIVGARAAGCHAVWIDRAGRGWEDACVPELQPDGVVTALGEVEGVILSHTAAAAKK